MDWGEGEYDEQKNYEHERIDKQDLCTEDEEGDEHNEEIGLPSFFAEIHADAPALNSASQRGGSR